MQSSRSDLFDDDLRLWLPCNIYVAGVTMVGKSSLILRLIKHAKEIFKPTPKSILYCYGGKWNDQILDFEKAGAIVHRGTPTEQEIEELEKPALVILDDLMLDMKKSYLADVFTRGMHHNNLGVIFVTQYLYTEQTKIPRTNSQYVFLMHSPTEEQQRRNLATQWFSGNRQFFLDAYKQATNDEPFRYIMINNHPKSKSFLRLQTQIFPGEERIVFRPA